MHQETSVWTGLSVAQHDQLRRDLRRPPRMHLPMLDAYRSLAAEYAHRIAALVAANDIRGALWVADLWAHCDQACRGEPLRHERDNTYDPAARLSHLLPQRAQPDAETRRNRPARRQATRDRAP